MTSTTDIGNRALQLLGTRTTMTSLAEASNEAAQINLAISPITNWCFGLANWNFARKTTALGFAKGPPPSPPGNWSIASPSLPWNFEYTLPADFIRAIYVTDNTPNASNNGWLGEPKRFQMGTDMITGVQQEVLYTNANPANIIYTANISDPTLWPWYFERLAVIALAQTTCMALVGSLKLLEELSNQLEQQISIATQVNMKEGLIIDDTTPEWIQALGINYPFRRVTDPGAVSAPAQPQPQGRR